MNAARTASPSGNRTLSSAKAAKQDEFYTQYIDIQKEVEAYLEFDPDTFKDKVVLCNCDDPRESKFFEYFAVKFNDLRLKKLIATCYDGSPIMGQQLLPFAMESRKPYDNKKRRNGNGAYLAVLLKVWDVNGDGKIDMEDVEHLLKHDPNCSIELKGDPGRWPPGDFRSPECVALLKEADIVVTNPPFSLFRDYVAQLVKHGKKFLIIGNQNATTYKEIFPLIKENKLWLGATIKSGDREFRVPDSYPLLAAGWRVDENGVKYIRVKGVRWFTNLDHGPRHQKLELQTMANALRYNKKLKGKIAYDRYDNYDAIEVPFTDAIPSDYDGVMGVPITFLDKYNPDQFEIVGGSTDGYSAAAMGVARLGPEYVGNVGRTKLGMASTKRAVYKRILIRHRRPQTS